MQDGTCIMCEQEFDESLLSLITSPPISTLPKGLVCHSCMEFIKSSIESVHAKGVELTKLEDIHLDYICSLCMNKHKHVHWDDSIGYICVDCICEITGLKLTSFTIDFDDDEETEDDIFDKREFNYICVLCGLDNIKGTYYENFGYICDMCASQIDDDYKNQCGDLKPRDYLSDDDFEKLEELEDREDSRIDSLINGELNKDNTIPNTDLTSWDEAAFGYTQGYNNWYEKPEDVKIDVVVATKETKCKCKSNDLYIYDFLDLNDKKISFVKLIVCKECHEMTIRFE